MLGKDEARLRHILESTELIEDYLAHINKAGFLNDRKLQDAISRRLEIIGEATKAISQSTRQKYPEVPWKEMAGMRDKLTHEYFGVDMEIIWETCQEDLPGLKEQVINILEDNV